MVALLLDLVVIGAVSSRADEGPPPLTMAAAKSGEAVDSQRDLQAIFDLASRIGRRVLLPAGRFYHSGTLSIRGIAVSGAGAATILEATALDEASVVVTGRGAALSNLKLVASATTRSQSDTSSLVLVENARDFAISELTLQGSNSVGIFVADSANGNVSENVIQGTLADSIHITAGSSDVVIRDNAISLSGDDGISVVSYEKNGRPVRDVSILHNSVSDNRFARGISVVGGEHIEVADNFVRCTAGYAGIYVASESSYRTYSSAFVTVRNNTVQKCGGARVGHGGITIFSDYKGNDHVSVVGNDIFASPAVGILVLGGPNVDLALEKNTIRQSHDAEIVLYRQDHPIVVRGNRREDGAAVSPRLIATPLPMVRERAQ
jgi:polygalacturonase